MALNSFSRGYTMEPYKGFMISNKVFQQHFSTVNISWTKNFFEKIADLGMKKKEFCMSGQSSRNVTYIIKVTS